MKKRIRFDYVVIGLLLLTTVQYRILAYGETRIKLPSDISFTHESSDNIEGEACYNRIKQMNGICTLPNECPEAVADFKKGIQPQICNYKGQLPIICCPRQNQTVASTTPKPFTLSQSSSTSTISTFTLVKSTTTKKSTQKPAATTTTTKSGATTRIPSSGPRISEEKCKEYVKLTFEESVITTLSLTPENQVVQKTKCRKASSEGFIVGGTKTEPGEFPHMAAIGWRQNGSDEVAWNCGGSLIRYTPFCYFIRFHLF